MMRVQDQLREAVNTGDLAQVKALCAQGADDAWEDYNDWSGLLLYDACKEGHVGIVQYLLARGANPSYHNLNYEGQITDTPLHVAANRGDVHIAEMLLAAGAEVNIERGYDYGSCTPLYLAVRGYDECDGNETPLKTSERKPL